MRILDRYILRELAAPFLLGLLIFTSLLLILRILKLVELVVSRGVPFLDVLRLFAYILPAFLELTVPMALLLAVLVAFGRLSADSELTALQASGVGMARLMAPVGGFALLVAALTLLLSFYVRPLGNRLLRTGLYEIVKARATAGLQPKVFNDDFEGLVIYAENVAESGRRLNGVLLSDTRTAGERTTVYARSGVILADERSRVLTLRLSDGGIYAAAPQRDAFEHTRFRSYDVRLDLSEALAKLRRRREPSELGIGELRAALRARLAAGERAIEERVELQRRWSMPVACLLFAATAAPLGIRPSRSVHSRGMSLSVAVVFVYYMLMTLGENLAARGGVPPEVALWLPNLTLGAVAAVLLARGNPLSPDPGWSWRAIAPPAWIPGLPRRWRRGK